MSKEQTIKNYMKNLDISRAEAEQLYEDDKNDFITEDGEKLEKKAKALPKKRETKVGAERKKRTTKPDPEKTRIISIIYNALLENGYNPTVTNQQREIEFEDYSITLIKHRPPKK